MDWTAIRFFHSYCSAWLSEAGVMAVEWRRITDRLPQESRELFADRLSILRAAVLEVDRMEMEEAKAKGGSK